MNENEELAVVLRDARAEKTKLAASMLRQPRGVGRWLLGGVRRLMAWVEREARAALDKSE